MKRLALGIGLFLHSTLAFAGYAPWGYLTWKQPVASAAALPASGNLSGDVRMELTSFGEYVWNGSGWTQITGSGGSPGGANTNIQFNSAGSFGGSANLTWSGTVLGVTGSVNASNFTDSALTSGLPVLSTAPLSTGTLSGNTTKFVTTTGVLTSGDGVKLDASGNLIDSGAVPATVTSVGLSAPAEFTVSGSPVTGSGTLTFTKATQSANTFWGGPTSGVAAAPAFRLLVGADIPNFGGATGIAAGTQGGVPAPSAGQQNNCLLGSGSWGTCGAGTVTSVGLADGSTSPIYSITGSPVTGSGTLTFSLSSQTANKVFAAPNGATGQPAFRLLVGSDLPSPTGTTLGGIESFAAVSHEWINSISTSGVPSGTQPAFTDISGTVTSAQLPATVVQTNQANTYSAGPQSLGTQVLTEQIPNAGTTGTTVNKLAKINSSGNAVIAATTDTTGMAGIVVAGAGTTGSADISQIGQTLCTFDGNTTAGDYVTISSSVAGDCTDAGATAPSATQNLGRVTTTHVGAASEPVILQLAGSGSGLLVQGQNDGASVSAATLEAPNNQMTSLGSSKSLIETGNDNLLKNPNFQASTASTSWSTGASVTAVADTGTKFGNDPQSIKVTLPAAFTGDAFYQDVTVPSGSVSGVNLESSLIVYNSGNVANLQVCARQGGADVSGSCANVPLGGSWAYTPSAGSGGGSGTTSIGVSLYASASTTGSVWVTHAYVGKNRNIGTVQQAQDYGSLTYGGAASCQWSLASASTSFSDFAANTNCPTPTVSGQASAPATKIPAITFTNAPGGSYYVFQQGHLAADSSSTCNYTVTDGTSFDGLATVPVSGAGYSLVGRFNYSAPQTSLTFQVAAARETGATNCFINSFSSTEAFSLKVIYVPSQSQTVASLAQASANASYTSTLSGTTTSTGITDPGSITGSVTVSGTPHNISCSADATKLGIDCTLPKAGNVIVCYSGVAGNSVAGDGAYSQLTDGSGAVIVGLQGAVSPSATQQFSVGSCGGYTASSTSVVFKVQGKATTGGTATFSPTSFFIAQTDSPGPQPYTTGNITSTGAGTYHHEAAFLSVTANTGTDWAIGSQSGNWISSVSTGVKGITTLTLAPNEFSQAPWCNVNSTASGTLSVIIASVSASSATSVTVHTSDDTGTDYSWPVNVQCFGPH